MFTWTVLVVFTVAGVCALAGNLAFFYMQSRIEAAGFRRKFFKNIPYLLDVCSQYRERVDLKGAPKLPLLIFRATLVLILICMCLLVFFAARYGLYSRNIAGSTVLNISSSLLRP